MACKALFRIPGSSRHLPSASDPSPRAISSNLPSLPLFLSLSLSKANPPMSFFSLKTSNSTPSETEGKQIDSEKSPLQKHAEFFDINKDGIIYPWETFQGFRAIGSGLALSTVGALFFNLGLSGRTRPNSPGVQRFAVGYYDRNSRKNPKDVLPKEIEIILGRAKFHTGFTGEWPSPLFPINVKNIKLAKHGSDSGVYDAEGRFVPSKFEDIFRKHAQSDPNFLTKNELQAMLRANREPKDYVGWLVALIEWALLYYLCKDKDGLLQKETVRGVYDGSLFEQMAKEKASG